MKIEKKIRNYDFEEIIRGKNIRVSRHALDHLSNAQRNIFKKDMLIAIIRKENPQLIELQKNGLYSVHYRRKWGFLKIIMSIKQDIQIVTFMNKNEKT